MESFTPVSALVGGLLMGISATMLLWFNGKIAGISGIINGALGSSTEAIRWRRWFLLGVVGGAGIYQLLNPTPFELRSGFSPVLLTVAGLLVGFGTRMGNGCTSGHGVCGLGRLSGRSLAAVLTFMLTAGITVYVARHVLEIV